MDGGLGDVALEDEVDIDGSGFEDVYADVRDVEVQDWEDGEGEENVEGEKEAIGVSANSGEGGGEEEEEGDDGG